MMTTLSLETTLTVLVTGGAGFIGSTFVREWLHVTDEDIVNVDKLTYAGNMQSLAGALENPRHTFVRADICDCREIREILTSCQPRGIVHFAAESHVDRSIHGPDDFVNTNIVGTFRILEEVRDYYEKSSDEMRTKFRFVNVSTDEVFGSLGASDQPFSESSPYRPNSPYSASKAAADHLVRAYFHTYKVPVITTSCSNNYGPYQFPEKLIPLMILNAIQGRPLPVYGDGQNVRDWLYVDDHCAAIRSVLENGQTGETYNIGGDNELTNLQVVQELCALLDEVVGRSGADSFRHLINFVEDRPGHDRRYAIDSAKIQRDLHWKPKESFISGLRKTVSWYLENTKWVADVQSGDYQKWIESNYANRAGLR